VIVVKRPMKVGPLQRQHRVQVAEWLNDPTIAHALDVRGTVTATHLTQRELPVLDGDGRLSMEGVFMYEACDAAGQLVGFCLSYAFDDATPYVRELDCAMPLLGPGDHMAMWETLVRWTHCIWSTEKPRELRVYVRKGKTVDGHTRIFTRIGSKPVSYEPRKNLRGLAFKMRIEDFYASPTVKRYGFRQP
jgi:hypothetical protein